MGYSRKISARTLDKALKKAEIKKETIEGKVDFHACRTAYITVLLEGGATVKEAQELARHATPQLTMNVYGRTRGHRLQDAVERVAEMLDSAADQALSMHLVPGGGATGFYRWRLGISTPENTPGALRRWRRLQGSAAVRRSASQLGVALLCAVWT